MRLLLEALSVTSALVEWEKRNENEVGQWAWTLEDLRVEAKKEKKSAGRGVGDQSLPHIP